MQFEWDPNKAIDNQRKHKVTFEEAATVFADTLGVTVSDPDHSAHEERYITVGLSQRKRLLMVAHTERDGRIRIISARELTPTEKRDYEQGDYRN
ncbi:MAG: BrnT family toxin [Anaerolineae bacterium]